MSRRILRSALHRALAALVLLSGGASSAWATDMLLKDGRVIEGDHVEVAGVAESPINIRITAGEVAVLPLLMFDDGLRRTFIHRDHVAQVLEDAPQRKVRIRVWQDVAEKGAGIGRIGRGRPLGPFDKFGRRTFEMQGRDGPTSVVQGITEITPTYTKIEGRTGGPPRAACPARRSRRSSKLPCGRTTSTPGFRSCGSTCRASATATRNWSSRRSSRISRSTTISTSRSPNCGNSVRT